MEFKIKVAEKGNLNAVWWEIYDRDVEDPKAWVKETIDSFNETLKSGETPRVLLDVEIIDSTSIKNHAWEKTNVYTIKRAGSMYDTHQCKKCKITGKRYGLGLIRRDPKYRAKIYERCDTSIQHLTKRGKL